MKKKIIFIIPAFNEEKNLKKVINDFKKYGDIITINDNSIDQTKVIADKYSNYVINNKERLGYDSSIRLGIKFVLKNLKEKEIVFTIDGDGQHVASEVPKFLKKVKNCDAVIGKRDFYNRYSEYIVGFFSKQIDNINDPLSGFKCYRKNYLVKLFKILKKIDYIGMFFLEKNKNIKQVNIRIKKNSKSSIGSGLKIDLKILITYFKVRFNLIF